MPDREPIPVAMRFRAEPIWRHLEELGIPWDYVPEYMLGMTIGQFGITEINHMKGALQLMIMDPDTRDSGDDGGSADHA